MDLIYADSQKKDIGIIPFYDFDLAYGRDENSFDLTIPLSKHCCENGFLIYIDGTEYGGIVDKIEVDTKGKKVKYSGRTWHGILNSKVVEIYNSITGPLNYIIDSILERCDFKDLYDISLNEQMSVVFSWRFYNEEPCYDAITRLLKSMGYKLSLIYNARKGIVELKPSLRIDYINDDYFDSDQLDFVGSKSDNVPNHVICILENDTERKKIHLFTDKDGIIQPYIKNSSALDDEYRYYLDKSQQVIFGKDEIVEVITSGIDVREIYHPVTSYPTDWVSNYEDYYHIEPREGGESEYVQNKYVEQEYFIKMVLKPDGWENNWDNYFVKNAIDNEYNPTSAVNENNYVLTNSEPDQWDLEFESYYEKNASDVFSPVQGIDDNSLYKPLNDKPKDWDYSYSNYFEWVGGEYVSAQSTENKPQYIPLTSRPQDWETSISNYYYKATKYKQINVGGQITAVEDGSAWLQADKYYAKDGSGVKTYGTIPNFVLNKYYSVEQKPIPPMWIRGRYYDKTGDSVAPTWKANKYYIQTTNHVPPTFVANTFYERRVNLLPKMWISGQYYRLQSDHYIVAIEKAIEELQTMWESRDNLEVDLPTYYNYDIGDVIGATDRITQLEIAQFVTKKIVKIKNGKISVNYEIGKEK